MIFKKNAKVSSDDKQLRTDIPHDIISMKGFGDKHPKEIVKYLASRMMFVSKNKIRILNEEGLDFLLHNKKKSKKFKLLSYTKIDNQKQQLTNEQPVHAFLEQRPLDLS